jgi:hypothetical protein
MTDAPERIWATEDADNGGEDRFHTTKPMRGLTEYIRADLVPGWQPIETAPRDGSEILVSDGEAVEKVSWAYVSNSGSVGWLINVNVDSGFNYYDQFTDPTHWMPLPTPPE